MSKLAVMVPHDDFFGMDPEMMLLTGKQYLFYYYSCATNITWDYVLLLWYETPSVIINFYFLHIEQVSNGFFKNIIAYRTLT